MKGPGGRRKFPIRRTWQCPRCKKRIVATGQVVHVLCSCVNTQGESVQMSIVDEPRPRKFSVLPPWEEPT